MGDSPQEKQAKDAKNAAKAATETQRGARDLVLGDPLFQGIRSIAEGIVQNPETFGPEQRQQLFDQTVSSANDAANAFLDDSRAQLSVGPGLRSGSSLNREFEIGSRLGEAVAQANRQVALTGAQQDRNDQLTAIGAGQGILDLLNQFEQQVANAQLGQGTVIAQAAGGASSQSPGAAIGQGVGQLGGAVLGNAGLFGGKG